MSQNEFAGGPYVSPIFAEVDVKWYHGRSEMTKHQRKAFQKCGDQLVYRLLEIDRFCGRMALSNPRFAADDTFPVRHGGVDSASAEQGQLASTEWMAIQPFNVKMDAYDLNNSSADIVNANFGNMLNGCGAFPQTERYRTRAEAQPN
ncbi:uncharacterized protein LACBIDRAFT_329891 [Laccaria bicolor S238N-H82]|uniref:Predicted protein n=1 Tax=Laccaria bicolor (strain S238N-H82 / ATCC MYA-4686) TaxID=486041 RepID=B0DJJ9_LACBS|nr:uncharacterized protein LACBIDRAFT_329891 [Laccaria bicolor S238N-H82]EDR05221.1 predicted protein [Laccaria bicolor S238N-H82]|eukprot:XP_001884186.1 predicted protein [Laccaria bicolor S238N-H82]